MKKDKQLKNLKIIFTILLLAILLVTLVEHKKNKAVVGFELDKIGIHIGKWKGTDMNVSERDRQWVEQGDLVMRSYHKGNSILYLVAIQEKGDRHRVHSPFDCYTGAGWTVLGKESIRLNGNKGQLVRRMRVVNEDASRLVYYWFTNGKQRCASFKGHLLLFLKDVLLTWSVDSWVCFQVSADILDSQMETDSMMRGFISELEGLIIES